MIDLTKPHNWIALLLAFYVIGFVTFQAGQRVAFVGKLNRATGRN